MNIITGKPSYVLSRIRTFTKQGYIMIKTRSHPDGTITVKMVKV